MKIEIRYQSRGGNTKEAAETIAKALGITAYSIEKPVTEPVDLLIIGGGVYKWDIDPALKHFLKNINPALVKSAAAFTTAGGMDKTKIILSILKERSIQVRNETLAVKVGIKNHAWFGGKGSITLKEKQIHLIHEFANALNRI